MKPGNFYLDDIIYISVKLKIIEKRNGPTENKTFWRIERRKRKTCT